MKKQAFLILSLLSAFALAACGTNDEPAPEPSSEPAQTTSEAASTTSVDPNANKRVTEALFTSEVTNWGMFGLDRKVTVTGTSPDIGGENYSVEMTVKIDTGKVSIHQDTKLATGELYRSYDSAFVIEKNSQDNKLYYKERYAKNGQNQWTVNKTAAEFKYDVMYDTGIIADKYVYSAFTFDETSGTYKCASASASIYGDDYTLENIEIAFENNKVKSITNKLTSQNAEHPGSYTMTNVFSNHGTTTVTLPEVEEGPTNKELEDVFKNVGEETIYLAASKTRPAKSLYTEVTSEMQRRNLLGTPGVLLYLVGKLYENEDFDCLDKLVRFRCVYDLEYQPGNVMILDNTLDLMIHVDKEKGQLLFYGYQDSLQGDGEHMTPVTSPIYMEIEYNFETNEMGDFKFWEKSGMSQPQSTNYCDYIEGILRELDYNHRNDDDDYANETAIIEAAEELMNEKRETMTVADAATALIYGQAFIDTQAYANSVFGSNIPMTIHED